MITADSDFDSSSPADLADPHTFSPDDISSGGAVFVIPMDAPVPAELGPDAVPSGSLYARLVALASPDTGSFSFAPVSGAELLHLERAWRLLQTAHRVFALFDLPGARYDVMFTQAVRQIGLRKVDWPAVAESIAAKATIAQRTKDAKPWAAGDDLTKPSRRLPAMAQVVETPLGAPPDED